MVFLGPLELGYSLWKTLLPNHSCLREKTRLRCPFLNFRNPLKVVQENEIILVILFLLIYLRHQFHLYLDCYIKYYWDHFYAVRLYISIKTHQFCVLHSHRKAINCLTGKDAWSHCLVPTTDWPGDTSAPLWRQPWAGPQVSCILLVPFSQLMAFPSSP